MHVVFYETGIKASELMAIMNYESKSGFTTIGVHPRWDEVVYKLSSRQLFRHVLSSKNYSPYNKQNKMNHGYII